MSENGFFFPHLSPADWLGVVGKVGTLCHCPGVVLGGPISGGWCSPPIVSASLGWVDLCCPSVLP